MTSPQDPEELFDEMVPQLSLQLVDRLLGVATEYLACIAGESQLRGGAWKYSPYVIC